MRIGNYNFSTGLSLGSSCYDFKSMDLLSKILAILPINICIYLSSTDAVWEWFRIDLDFFNGPVLRLEILGFYIEYNAHNKSRYFPAWFIKHIEKHGLPNDKKRIGKGAFAVGKKRYCGMRGIHFNLTLATEWDLFGFDFDWAENFGYFFIFPLGLWWGLVDDED